MSEWEFRHLHSGGAVNLHPQRLPQKRVRHILLLEVERQWYAVGAWNDYGFHVNCEKPFLPCGITEHLTSICMLQCDLAELSKTAYESAIGLVEASVVRSDDLLLCEIYRGFESDIEPRRFEVQSLE